MKEILLVEDDPEIVMLLHLHYSDPGYSLTVCSRGREAVQRPLNEYFDLIILDISLPDMDGIEVCRKLMEKQVNRPVLVMIPGIEENEQLLALAAGAGDYITKPFSMHELHEKVTLLIDRADRLQMLQTVCDEEQKNDLNSNMLQAKAAIHNPENN